MKKVSEGRDADSGGNPQSVPSQSNAKYELIKPSQGTEIQLTERGEEPINMIEFTFKIEGMTCVACSNSIERLMHSQFDPKGMKSVSIVLLTHKMLATFPLSVFTEKTVTPQIICDTVPMIGFGCELLGMTEVTNVARKNLDQEGNLMSEASIDSHKIRGGDEDSIDRDYEQASPSKIRAEFSSSEKGTPQSQKEAVTIKQAKIEIKEPMGAFKSAKEIETKLSEMAGVVDVQCKVEQQPSHILVSYKTNGAPLRDIIKAVKELGYVSAKYLPESSENGIKEILAKEVKKYRTKFLLALIIELPILIFMWVVPYTNPEFLTDHVVFNGMPAYIFILLGLSSIIQFYFGIDFYRGAYKSVRACSANMDVLVVLGTTAAWLYGLILIFIGDHEFGTGHHEMVMDHKRHMVHEHAHNFEIAATLITVILFGKFLESVSKKQTVDKLSQLASLKVTKATLMKEGASLSDAGQETEVELLVVGDVIKVINGQTIPIDGLVISGTGLVNESMLTGEARPVNKEISSKVFGGTMLIRGAILVKVDRLAELSAINQIMKLVESAQSAKAPIQGFADKIARYFVPTIVLLSVIAWIFWFSFAYSEMGKEQIWLGGTTRFVFAFNFGVSTLVIACPCALGLATPTAVMVGTGIAASFGVLIKGGDVLERINGITTVVFDKTGTLTAGSPHVSDLIDVLEKFKPARLQENNEGEEQGPAKFTFQELLTVLYLCESSSEHPLAKAMVNRVVQEYKDVAEDNKFKLSKFKNINGEGVVANIFSQAASPKLIQSEEAKAEAENEEGEDQLDSDDGKLKVLCGNDKLMDRFGVDLEFNNFRMNMQSLEKEGKTVVCLAINGTPRLLISLEEAHLAKPEALGVVKYLRNVLKVEVAMITGDNEHAAMKVARYLDIPTKNVTFRAYPNDKKRTVKRFQAAGQKVMFVGDGVNDSPVLAQAEVGVAINSASDITVQAAGIVAMKDRLDDVLNAILISKLTFRRIKINFAWAFVYNIVLVPIAMGFLYPIGAHPGSDDPNSELYDKGEKGLQLDPMWAGFAMALSSVSVVLSSLFLKTFKYRNMQEIEKKSSEERKGKSGV